MGTFDPRDNRSETGLGSEGPMAVGEDTCILRCAVSRRSDPRVMLLNACAGAALAVIKLPILVKHPAYYSTSRFESRVHDIAL